jgi:YVTN family beta-propeller protein
VQAGGDPAHLDLRQPENAAVVSDGTIFVPNVGSNTVSRIDPATNTVIETISVGSRPFPAASAFGDVWVPSSGGRRSFACTSVDA